MGTAHRIAIVLTPVVAIATLAVGLRVGAGRTVHAAVVYAAPRARGATGFAWQMLTLVEDNGAREAEKRSHLTVHARAKGQEATWTGDTGDDGVAEVGLELPGVVRGDPIDLEVLAEGVPLPLAKGRAAWDDVAWMNAAPGPFARPSRREGAIALDVAVLGGKLVARNDAPVWIRATSRDDGHPLSNVTLVPDPEPGLDVRAPSATTCALGWARLDASARIYVTSLSLHAKLPDGRTGEWSGSLPVATGSTHAAVANVARDHADFTVFGSSAVYAEVDDDEGRAFATWVVLPRSDGADGDRAAFRTPTLAPGLKWLVTSSEPRGAEVLDEGTIARPFLIDGKPMPAGAPSADDPCAVGAYLALHPAGGFHRWLALDGFVARKDENGARRKRGLAIGLGSLAIASVLELILLLQAARRGRALSNDADVELEAGAALMKRSSAGSVFIGVLLALLGFGLLAALLLEHA